VHADRALERAIGCRRTIEREVRAFTALLASKTAEE